MEDSEMKPTDNTTLFEPFWFRSGFRTMLWVVFVGMWLNSKGKHLGKAIRDRDSSEVAIGLSMPILVIAWDTYVSIRNWKKRRAKKLSVPTNNISAENLPVGSEGD